MVYEYIKQIADAEVAATSDVENARIEAKKMLTLREDELKADLEQSILEAIEKRDRALRELNEQAQKSLQAHFLEYEKKADEIKNTLSRNKQLACEFIIKKVVE